MTDQEKQKLGARLRLAQRALVESQRQQSEHESALTSKRGELTDLSYNFENQKKQLVGAVQELEGPSRALCALEVSVAQDLVTAAEKEIETANLKAQLAAV